MAEVERRCTLPDAKLVVAWNRWEGMIKRLTLPDGVKLVIPYSLWEYRAHWINPGLASDHMCGLPSDFFYHGILVGEVTPTWGTQRKVPRAYLRVGYLLSWLSERRIRCNWRTWQSMGYLRCRYSWPEPR